MTTCGIGRGFDQLPSLIFGEPSFDRIAIMEVWDVDAICGDVRRWIRCSWGTHDGDDGKWDRLLENHPPERVENGGSPAQNLVDQKITDIFIYPLIDVKHNTWGVLLSRMRVVGLTQKRRVSRRRYVSLSRHPFFTKPLCFTKIIKNTKISLS